jgi:hypothetical protein
MPNTRPPIDTEGLVQHVHHQGRAARKARVFAAACATKGRQGKQLAPISGLARAGAAAFTDDGDCVADAGVMARALRTVRATGRSFMQHCQDPALTRGAVMNAGALATRLALGGWPRAAEENILQRDVQLNRAVGCRYHAQHVSSGGSVEIIRRARADRMPVTAEVTPHHLLLTEDLCREYDTVAKVNPPLRTSGDIEQIMTIIRERPDEFLVLSGDDAMTLPVLALGGDGVVSVVANEAPKLMSDLVRAALAGDLERARQLHYGLLPLMQANFVETNPIPVKAALGLLGLVGDEIRLPLTRLTDANRERLQVVLKEIGLV